MLEFRVANGHKSPAMCVEASAVLSQFNREQICKSYHRLVLEQKDDPGWLVSTRRRLVAQSKVKRHRGALTGQLSDAAC